MLMRGIYHPQKFTLQRLKIGQAVLEVALQSTLIQLNSTLMHMVHIPNV